MGGAGRRGDITQQACVDYYGIEQNTSYATASLKMRAL
jgi:hypothetical protein